MASLPIKLLLFGSSYVPLALVFFFLYLENKPFVAWICFGIAVFCFLAMLLHFEVVARRRSRFTVTVQTIRRRDGDVLSYIASYLIPFVSVPFSNTWQECAALLLFIGVLAVVYINSDMLHINPMLILCGFHVYEVSIKGEPSAYFVLGRGRIAPNERIDLTDLADWTFLKVPPRRNHVTDCEPGCHRNGEYECPRDA